MSTINFESLLQRVGAKELNYYSSTLTILVEAKNKFQYQLVVLKDDDLKEIVTIPTGGDADTTLERILMIKQDLHLKYK